METRKLYYADSHLKAFSAVVTGCAAAEGGFAVTLDATAFYPTGGGQAEKRAQPATPYDIPYRSLLPKNVEGLLLSGRNISGTHRAHASYRVMGVAMATGQAAGMAAALSAKEGCTPRALDYHKVQSALMAYGAELFKED